jgi:hypothetical protein
VNLTAQNVGYNNAASTVNFSITDGDTALNNNTNSWAFSNIGGPGGGSTPSFDWGLPFFYGRSVYTAIEAQNTPAGAGPYIAY